MLLTTSSWTRSALITFFVLVSTAPSSWGRPLNPDAAPEPLKPWIPWVLHQHPDHRCPFLFNSSAERHCAWPNALTLDLTASQGSFRQQWTLFTESLVALPGNRDAWPQDVIEGTRPLVVVEKENLPYITLSAGSHTVTGRFTWPRLPEQVHIPSATGLVHLTLNHQIVPFPKQDPNGQLWMQQPTTAATGVSNTLDLQVFRRISDDIPFQILTRIQLDVDGEARELLLGQALLPSFIPFSLTSPLPPRLEPDGRLRIQVRPGRCTVDPDQLQLSRSYWLDFPGAGYTIQDTITGTVNKT